MTLGALIDTFISPGGTRAVYRPFSIRAPAVVTGMSGSLLGMAQLTTSAVVELGVARVWKRNTPSSFWMSPRQSLSSWLWGRRYSDIRRVLDRPSLILLKLTISGVLRLP